tara:strand:+ start:3995 stop:4291 length:297 start_codon:yes stop_codon:yes gene_type:complete
MNPNGRQVKKWLIEQGVQVKYIRSINGTRQGKKVTHYIEARSGSLDPIFSQEMRKTMLKLTYGESFYTKNDSWIAGNVAPHCVNLSPGNWASLMELAA